MLGLEVEVGRDGQAAVDSAGVRTPGIVILDLGMPQLDGWQACKQMWELPGGALDHAWQSAKRIALLFRC